MYYLVSDKNSFQLLELVAMNGKINYISENAIVIDLDILCRDGSENVTIKESVTINKTKNQYIDETIPIENALYQFWKKFDILKINGIRKAFYSTYLKDISKKKPKEE